MAGFYAQVLGLTPADVGPSAASGGRPDRAVSDGAIALAFRDVFAETSGHKPRYGLARCGFSAPDNKPVADLRDPDGNSIVFTTRQTTGGELWRA
jgi:hypothetical protein